MTAVLRFSASSALIPGMVLTLVSCAQAQQKAEYTVTVSAEKMDYAELPVSVEVPMPAGPAVAELRQINPDRAVECQLVLAGGKAAVWWILDELNKGATRTYKLTIRPPHLDEVQSLAVKVEQKDGTVDVSIQRQLFTTYHFKDVPKPVLYPLIGPTGVNVTRHYPMRDDVAGEAKDHVHHRSFWWTHGAVSGVDFWSEGAKAGKTVHQEFEALASGPVLGLIRSRNAWIKPDGAKALEDTREIRIYNIASGRMLDFSIELRATDGPVVFGDTKEGSFGIRLAEPGLRVDKGGHMENANGDKDGNCWGKQAAWCDDYGTLEGKVVGVAIMDSPQSFRYPTYWHARTYGLFAANPFGLHDFRKEKGEPGKHEMAQGESIRFLYRVFIHEGDTQTAKIGERQAQFAEPPTIEIK